ncbi:Mitochondrial-processing peptidase subunit alpha, partial [Linderina pennispora]
MSALLKTTGRLAAGRMGGFNRQLLGVCGSMRYKSTTLRQTEMSKDGHTTTTTLANGLRITSEHNPGHFTALGVYVDAGSRYEDGATAGYAHLMDRLAFRNSAQFTSSAAMAAIEKLGGSIMSSSTRECIMYQAAVFPQDAGLAMQLLADTTLRPRVLPEDIEELQATVPWELQDVASKPEMFLPEKLHETAFQTGTLGNPLLCPPMQLAQATPERLAKYHSRWYRPERMVVAAVGMEHEELVRLCDANGFADLPRTEPQQKQKEPWITVPNGQAVYTGGTWF